MKKHILFISLLLMSSISFGQISYGGEPVRWEGKSIDDVPFKKLKVSNSELQNYRSEDIANDQDKYIPYRFGVNVLTDLSTTESGNWTELEDGSRVWRLGIDMSGALSINFEFDVYDIPEGGEVFVYTPDMSQIIGKFTTANTSDINSLGVGLIPSDRIIIEYFEPANVVGQGYLHINQVTYGYREILDRVQRATKAGPFGNSGACNIDVNCAELGLYDLQKRSVALIVNNGNSVCSGALVNNTLQDQTPFFLTANHCVFNPNSVQNWVFYFNHEVPECGGSDNDAPTNFTVSGSTLLANNQESDFALLELNSNIPASYNVCYSGWDATDETSTVTSTYGIHHPSGDVKKICFDEDAPVHDQGFGFVNQVWYINEWEEGVTEGGSSGSPLFNQSGFIIGQLAGGQAACNGTVNNGQYDFYGRMGVSWDFGDTPQTRLRDWLDPAETGQLILPNSCAANAPENDLSLGGFTNNETLYCSIPEIAEGISVINTGSNDINSFELAVEFNGLDQGAIEWTGTLESFQSTTIELGDFQLENGSNELIVTITEVNGGDDSNEIGNEKTREYEAIGEPAFVSLTIQLDEYPDETSWRIQDQSGVIYYSGGGYTEELGTVQEDDLCLPEGCYDFIIEDSWGDGICCEFGDGSYTLVDETGAVLAEGGEFGDSETTNFCVQYLSTDENEVLRSISVFPNPASDMISIQIGDVQKIEQILITDLLGRVVDQKAFTSQSADIVQIQTSEYRSGVYLFQIKTEAGTAVRKVIIE